MSVRASDKASPNTALRLFAVVRPHLGWVLLAGMGVLIKEVARVSVYLFVGQALDVVVGVSSARLDRLLLIEGLLVVAIGLHGFAAVMGMFRATGMSVHDWRRATIGEILRKPLRFFEESRTGDLVSRVSSDCETMEGFVIFVCQSALFRTLMLLMTMGFMLYLNWKIALANFIVLPLGYLLSRRVTRPLERKSSISQECLGRVTATASDVVQGAVEMKAFGMEHALGEAHDRSLRELERSRNDIARTEALVGLVNRATYLLPVVVSYGLGAILVLRGEMTPGEVLAMQYVVGSFDLCVDFAFELFGNIRTSTAAGRRVFQIWDSPAETQLADAADAMAAGDWAVQLDSIGFSYAHDWRTDEGAPWVFRNLSLSVRRGESVAIVGRSGCGKTTLLRLLAGFYLPQEGSVRVLGRHPLGNRLAETRACIALVSQEPYLFPVSVRENIAHGRGGLPEAAGGSQEEGIEQAARRAGIHDFILSLPRGYDSLVGERGVKLSGGQRQRLAIARAFYKDAPLLLLDEPTSSLDSGTENQVQQSIAELMAGRTTVVAAHRLSTIKGVDRIYVMEKGSIVEIGTHEELVALGGLYRELYRRQAEGKGEMT